MNVEEIIGNLLMRTSCVIVPDFGGFISNTKSATIDYSKGVVYPPTKSITFNKSLNNNDGLLVNEFGKLNHLNYSDSLSQITEFVRETKSRLKAGERINFEKVGFLYADENGSLRFEQDRFFNLLMESYGMGTIQFIPEQELAVEQESKTTSPTLTKTTSPIIPLIPTKKSSGLTKFAKYAAAAALLPILFYSFWIPTHTDVLRSGILYKDDFNPLKTTSEAIYLKNALGDVSIDHLETDEAPFLDVINSLPESVSVFSFKLNEDTYIPVRLKKALTTSPESIPAEKSISTNLKYHLIAGCFGNKSNAENLVKELSKKGLNAYIVDFNNGLHRVSVAQSNDKNALSASRAILESTGFSSWVLTK